MTWTSAEDVLLCWADAPEVFRAGWKSWQLNMFKYQVTPQNHLGSRDLMFHIMWFLWRATYRACSQSHHVPWTLVLFLFLWSISLPLFHLLLLVFCFSFFMVIVLREKLAFISDYKRERLQRAALYLGHVFIRGNGWKSLLRQSPVCWLFKRNQLKCFPLHRCRLLYL